MACVLILDDEDSVRALLRVVLDESGYEVAEAASVDTAAALCEQRPADLLITDIFLPEADAPAKMRDLVLRHPSMKVIAISGAANQGTALGLATLLGARRILQKPFGIHEMLEEVRVQMAEPREADKAPARSPSQSTPPARSTHISRLSAPFPPPPGQPGS